MNRTRGVFCCLFVTLVGLQLSQCFAAVVLPTLPAGTPYQIVFRTNAKVSGSSSSVATYNNLATSQAALSAGLPATNWQAVVSTPAVAANVNAPSSVAVYNTQGQLIAPAGMYGVHIAGVNYDQFGTGWNPSANSIFVWTGSQADGTASLTMGSSPNVTAGDVVTSPGDLWAQFGSEPRTASYPIYALSEVLIAVPEPSSVLLAGFALLAITVVRRRRTPRHA